MRTFIWLTLSGCLLNMSAAPNSIGVIQSNGEFRIDGSAIAGNANLFEGSLVETVAARSTIRLEGVQVTLMPNSHIKVFHDYIEAGSLRIAPRAKGSVMQVATDGTSQVSIDASAGAMEVRNSTGVLVAVVTPGAALALDSSAAAETAFKGRGVLRKKGGAFLLTDATSNVTVKLQGTDLDGYEGQTVEVAGVASPPKFAVAEGLLDYRVYLAEKGIYYRDRKSVV